MFTDTEAAKIIWKFICPTSPWWWHSWENILIGCIKQTLRVLGRASLNFEELYKVVCDVEGIINSRPLTNLYEGMDELVPLTPNMFLQGIRESGLPDLNNLEKVDVLYKHFYIYKS